MRSRIVPAALLCACLASLAACGDSDTESAAPTAKATVTATASTAASTPVTDKVPGDKELCDTINKAGSTMKNGISQAQKADGHVEVVDAKKAFTDFHKTVNEALAFAETTEVTTAARAVANEVEKAAGADDPISAAAAAGFGDLSGKLTTACQTAGVTINF